ncbi:hypothetical protein C8F04DRAFT_954637 [Mycena alexandri]|uniref:Reverse transcriptase zinc-binding domain-containing protein n=1 Tax=Mycena alexandri TaxID=1745969 RepID=A0AAD6SXD0_9AGAR|nr:hypothetical protein C8F04DRAFT_954637 [Mycena alexandri]
MEFARGAACGADNILPPKKKLWRATRHKDFSRSIRFFMWMLLHDGYKVGDHWTNIPGHTEKATCSHCGVTESMSHILTNCDAPGQSLVWDLASELWKRQVGPELRPTISEIMACGAITCGNKGTTRLLFRIIVSESAHLIWKLRNNRVINEEDPASNVEIQNKWRKATSSRLLTDKNVKYGNRAIDGSLVKSTWCKVLKDEYALPKYWYRETGVLVGIG